VFVLSLKWISRCATAFFFSLAFFFAIHPFSGVTTTSFYIQFLSIFDAYGSSSVFSLVYYAVYAISLVSGILLIVSFYRKSRNKESVEELAAVNLALQGFFAQAANALYLQSDIHGYTHGGGVIFFDMAILFVFISTIVLLATALVLLTHQGWVGEVGQVVSALSFVYYLFSLVSILGGGSRLFQGISLILLLTSAMSIYYLRKFP
jgi:hypothetical protein